MAFASYSTTLVPQDENGTDDVFVHDRAVGTTIRVSTSALGMESNDWSFEPVISADGNVVAYRAHGDHLAGGDSNERPDIIVWERWDAAVEVFNVDPALEAAISASTLVEGQTLTVSGTVLDPSPLDTLSVTISWGAGQGSTTLSHSALTPVAGQPRTYTFSTTHRYDNQGDFLVTVRVQDDDGGVDERQFPLRVNHLNRSPVVVVNSPLRILLGESVQLDASASHDPDEAFGDQIVDYLWDLTSDTEYDFATQEPVLSLTPEMLAAAGISSAGTYTFGVTAFDSFGAAGGATGVLEVLAVAPIVASGAGQYRLSVEDQGTADTRDDLIQLTRGSTLLASRYRIATSSISITGGASLADSLTIDFSEGSPLVAGGVRFDGLTGTDTLVLENGDFGSSYVEIATSRDGLVTLSNASGDGTVRFTGLEQVQHRVAAEVVSAVLGSTNDALTLTDLADGRVQLNGSTLPTLVMTSPAIGLEVYGGRGTDSLVLGSDISQSNLNLHLDVETVTLGKHVSLLGLTVAGAGTLSKSTGVTLTVAEDVSFDRSGKVTLNGPLSARTLSVTTTDVVTLNGAISAQEVSVITQSTSATSIQQAAGGALVANDRISLTTSGGIGLNGVVQSGVGGVDLAAGAGSVLVTSLETAGTFASAGAGTFSVASFGGAHLFAEETIQIQHGGAVTLRGEVRGRAVTVESGGTTSLAVNLVSGAVLSADSLYVSAIASTGGVTLAGSTTGNQEIMLDAGDASGAVSVGTVLTSQFTSTGGGGFTQTAANSLVAEMLLIAHGGAATLGGRVRADDIHVMAGATGSSAVRLLSTGTLEGGSVLLNALNPSGGIRLDGSVTADSVSLVAGELSGAVSVGPITARQFESSGGGVFSNLAGTQIVTTDLFSLAHGGALTLRGHVEGNVVAASSRANTASAIQLVTGATLSAGESLHLVAYAGGGGIKLDGIATATGETVLDAGDVSGAVSVSYLDTSRFSSTGGGTFTTPLKVDPAEPGWLASATELEILHGGAVTLYGTISGTDVTLQSGAGVTLFGNLMSRQLVVQAAGTVTIRGAAGSIGSTAITSTAATSSAINLVSGGQLTSLNSINLYSAGGMTLAGLLDALDYELTVTGTATLTGTGHLVFHVDTSDPRILMHVTGRLTIQSGADVTVDAYGPTITPGLHTLVKTTGKLTAGSIDLVKSGPNAASIDRFFMNVADDPTVLALLLV